MIPRQKGTTVNASTVSRQLRKAGFSPSHDRHREGVRVSAHGPDAVRVSADLDYPAAAGRLARDLYDALIELGYSVTTTSDAAMIVRAA
jgi:hypothetical protein